MDTTDTRPERDGPTSEPDDPVRVGVLSLHNSKETKAILNAVEALGHRPEWLREENLVVSFDDRASLSPDVDVVVNRLLLSNTDQPAEHLGLAGVLECVRPVLNTAAATARASHKVATAAALVAADVPVPRTALALSGPQLDRLRAAFGDVAVYKTAIGTHGGGVWRVGTAEPLSPTVGKRRAFLQTLIGRDDDRPRDLRVYVVGDEVVGAMYRTAAPGDWRANVARGGIVADATGAEPAAEAIARRATAAVGLDVAGVDLVEGPDGWYVLEVNPTAGFRGLYAATGQSPAPAIARLAIEHVGGTVADDRVRELSATLDDSIPDCKPVAGPVGQEPQTIGLTEYVAVSGTTGSRTVVAQADTGTARTSVDLRLAADVGAGPIHTAADREAERRPVVDVVLGIAGDQHTVAATIQDRSGAAHPVLLGRDVLTHYRLDVGRRVEDADEYDLDEE